MRLFKILLAVLISICFGLLGMTMQSRGPSRGSTESSEVSDAFFATVGNPSYSPSGNYLLSIEGGFHGVVNANKFVIYALENPDDPIFVSGKEFRTRDRLCFLWDENDNVWVYSGDVGIFCWEKHEGGWTETIAHGDLPDALQRFLD